MLWASLSWGKIIQDLRISQKILIKKYTATYEEENSTSAVNLSKYKSFTQLSAAMRVWKGDPTREKNEKTGELTLFTFTYT